MFKKKKLNSMTNRKKILNYITYIWLFILFVLSAFLFNKITNWNFNIYKNIINIKKVELTEKEKNEIERIKIQKEKEELEKKEKLKKEIERKIKKELDAKKTNILVIWRWGYGNDAPELTDSLIVLSYFKEKKHISMLSIPRDLYVEYGDKDRNWKNISAKINGLYVHYLEKFQNRKKAVKKLEEKIEEITWEEIDYYINLDFNWFVKLINSIDWITVDVKRNLYDDKYPDINHWFQIFSLSKWRQKLYWQSALKYARSRKNTGWDFWRSERQQQILKALKETILSNDYLTSPSKIKGLYNIFDKYIKTDIWLIDFTTLATSIKLQDNIEFYSSTLNVTCIINEECDKGGFLYYPERKYFWWQSVVLPEWTSKNKLSNYKIIKKYSEIVFNTPSLFKEKFKISIFANKKDLYEAKELMYDLKKYWFEINVLERIWIISKSKKASDKRNKITLAEYNSIKNKNKLHIKINESNDVIVDSNSISKEYDNLWTKIIINWVDINSNTIKFLKKYLDIENKDIITNIDWPKYAKDINTDIEILFKK